MRPPLVPSSTAVSDQTDLRMSASPVFCPVFSNSQPVIDNPLHLRHKLIQSRLCFCFCLLFKKSTLLLPTLISHSISLPAVPSSKPRQLTSNSQSKQVPERGLVGKKAERGLETATRIYTTSTCTSNSCRHTHSPVTPILSRRRAARVISTAFGGGRQYETVDWYCFKNAKRQG